MLNSPQISQIENTSKVKIIKSQEINYQSKYYESKNNKNIMNKNIPIAIYNTCLSPSQSMKDFSVKMENSLKGKLDINKIFHNSPFQQNNNNKIFQSQNMKNSYSDLPTSASFNSQKSTESFFSNNNKQHFISTNFVLMPRSNFKKFQSHRKVPSSVDYPIDLNNNYCYRNNLSSKGLTNIINNTTINQNINQNLSSINFDKNNNIINDKAISNLNSNNMFPNNNINNEQNYFQTQKSVNFSEQKNLINNDIMNIESFSCSSSNNLNILTKNDGYINNNGENQNRKKSKNYYNKFNPIKENNMNENTVILTLKIKLAKNDYRYFNLKKYDDLFVSLEKFVEINNIRQDLVKPLVSKIFKSLNKIFWLLNNKIGLYDQEYLNSLYKLWIKNQRKIPKSRHKANSDKSTTTSSDSSSESSYKDIKSNSFQNTDGNSGDEKERQHTSNSF